MRHYKLPKRFTYADMEANSPRARFRSLARTRGSCDWCERKRLISTRTLVCESCFVGEIYGEPRYYKPRPELLRLSLLVLEAVGLRVTRD